MSNYNGRRKYYKTIYARKKSIVLSFAMIAVFWTMYFVQFRGTNAFLIVIALFSLYFLGYAVIAILMRLYGKPINAVVMDDTIRISRKGNRIHDLLLQCDDESGTFYTVYRYIMRITMFNMGAECPYNIGDSVIILRFGWFITIRDD